MGSENERNGRPVVTNTRLWQKGRNECWSKIKDDGGRSRRPEIKRKERRKTLCRKGAAVTTLYAVQVRILCTKEMPGVGPPDVAHNHISWFNWRILQRRAHIGQVEPRNELFCSISHPIRTNTPVIKPVLFLLRLSMWTQHRAIYLSGRGIPGIGITSGILFYCSTQIGTSPIRWLIAIII